MFNLIELFGAPSDARRRQMALELAASQWAEARIRLLDRTSGKHTDQPCAACEGARPYEVAEQNAEAAYRMARAVMFTA